MFLALCGILELSGQPDDCPHGAFAEVNDPREEFIVAFRLLGDVISRISLPKDLKLELGDAV
jgi:hypothetical protein